MWSNVKTLGDAETTARHEPVVWYKPPFLFFFIFFYLNRLRHLDFGWVTESTHNTRTKRSTAHLFFFFFWNEHDTVMDKILITFSGGIIVRQEPDSPSQDDNFEKLLKFNSHVVKNRLYLTRLPMNEWMAGCLALLNKDHINIDRINNNTK